MRPITANLALLFIAVICFLLGGLVATGNRILMPTDAWALFGLAAWAASGL